MGSRTQSSLIRTALFGAALFLAATGIAHAQCEEAHVMVKGGFGEARFNVVVADEPAERSQGLMHVKSMARSTGMLFVFEKPQSATFWMKNTLIPLDMIFADPAGQIIHIHENAIPHDETPIPGGDGVLAVLEINGGMSAMFGFKVGDALLHPAFLSELERIKCKE